MAQDRNSDLSGSVRTFIYGEVLNKTQEAQEQAKKDGDLGA